MFKDFYAGFLQLNHPYALYRIFAFVSCHTRFRLESSSDHITIEDLNSVKRILTDKFQKKE